MLFARKMKQPDENKAEVKSEVEETAKDFAAVTEEQPEEKKAGKDAPKFYEGYDIRWLKKEGEGHPDFKLVAEYEEKYGKI